MTREAVLIDRDGHPTLRFERRLGAPLERVWHAVTDEAEMRSWFPAAVQGERKVGAPLRFPFDDDVADTFDGEVTVWEPMRVFAFTWGGEQLRIELTPDGDATHLVFTHDVPSMSEVARTGAGWHPCLDSLDALLGGPAPDPDAWKVMYPVYLQRIGPPLGVPAADGSMTWDRRHHVKPDEVDAAFADPASWGADEPFDDVACAVTGLELGTAYRVTHRRAATEPALAAQWHALLAQLDLYLAAKQLEPVDPALFLDDYRQLLSS